MAQTLHVIDQVSELVGLAAGLLEGGEVEHAEGMLVGLRAIAPDHPELNLNLGLVFAAKGKIEEAAPLLRGAASLEPVEPVFWNALSACELKLGDAAGALVAAERSLDLDPNQPDALSNRAEALSGLGQLDEALKAVERALVVNPGDPRLMHNQASVLRKMGRLEESLSLLDRALKFGPQMAQVHAERGFVLKLLGHHEEAIETYHLALGLDPGLVEAHWNLSLCNLLLGRFEAGWAGYEWRWQLKARDMQPRPWTMPLWLGQVPLEGHSILLHCEQGYGDSIQFARLAMKVAERGAQVILEVQAPLVPLFKGLPGLTGLFARGESLPETDFHCPLMSLPLALGAPFEPEVGAQPYLQPDPARLKTWAGRLGQAGRPRVGLVTSGSPTHAADQDRSLPLAQIAEFLPKGIDYHSLQQVLSPADQVVLDSREDISFWGRDLKDFADTLALTAHMDLVISVDTSVAHLAGGAGKPTWILLPFAPDWRWGLTETRTNWYPSATLFRQSQRRDWSNVLIDIQTGLLTLAKAKGT